MPKVIHSRAATIWRQLPVNIRRSAFRCVVNAEFETNLRRERQLEGIAKAKAAGVYKGRRPTINPTEVAKLKQEGMGAAEIAKRLRRRRPMAKIKMSRGAMQRLIRKKLQTTRRRLTNFAYMAGRVQRIEQTTNEILQAVVSQSVPEPTSAQVFLTSESTEDYRSRMIKEIIAEHQDAARAYEIISTTIGNMTDIHEREHFYLNEVRHLFTYVMVPNGPGRLIDVYDTCSEALTCLKSWTIESAIKKHPFNFECDRLPFDDDSVDGMLFCEVIEHFVMDPMFCLIEINRVLRPGGFIVLSTPNAASWYAIYQALQLRHPSRWPLYGVNAVNRTNSIHAREYLTSEIVLLLEARAGLGNLHRPISGISA